MLVGELGFETTVVGADDARIGAAMAKARTRELITCRASSPPGT
jgi:hypothetical protein